MMAYLFLRNNVFISSSRFAKQTVRLVTTGTSATASVRPTTTVVCSVPITDSAHCVRATLPSLPVQVSLVYSFFILSLAK